MEDNRVEQLEAFNQSIVTLSDAIVSKNGAKMAGEFKKVVPVFQQLGVSAKEVIK